MRIENDDLVSLGKMGADLSGSLNSSAVLLDHIGMFSLSLNWTGTFNGSFKLKEGSREY
jgi:hypothetical protein